MNEEIKEETTIKEENIYEKWVIGKDDEKEPNEAFCNKVKAGDFKFNFVAFILGAAYYAYRKCYAEAVALGIITVFLSIMAIFASIICQVLSLALFIGEGLLFYPIYKVKLDKYMEQKKDPKKYGGTSLLSLLIALLLMLGTIYGLIMSITPEM